MLMYAVVVHDGDIPGRPVVAHAVMDLVALSVEDVESRLVHVTMLLRFTSGAVFLEMDMQGLGQPVVGFDVMAAVGLRSVHKFDLRALAYPRQRAQPGKLVLEFVVTGDPPHENPVLLAAVVRFDAHLPLRLFRHYTLRLQRPAAAVRV